jgi:hypothetical protein
VSRLRSKPRRLLAVRFLRQDNTSTASTFLMALAIRPWLHLFDRYMIVMGSWAFGCLLQLPLRRRYIWTLDILVMSSGFSTSSFICSLDTTITNGRRSQKWTLRMWRTYPVEIDAFPYSKDFKPTCEITCQINMLHCHLLSLKKIYAAFVQY